MHIILIIIVFILIAVVIKAGLNTYKLKRIRRLEKKYHDYMRTSNLETETIPEFLENIPEIIDLLEQAGQKSKIISRIENTGLGYVQNLQGDLYENITTHDSECYTLISTRFKYAIGVYKKRLYESFNPFYWIELLIFLPQKLIEYQFGDNQQILSNWCVRFLNIIYWVISFLGSLFGILDYFSIH